MSGKQQINVVIGNREETLNDMYVEIIRDDFPSIDFTFSVATTAPDFIAQASDSSTDLALFMPPGNIDADPARPDSTPEEEAVHIIQAIKATHPIPIIVVAASPVRAETVLAAGADQFIYVPAQPGQIESAVAACLKL